MAENSEKTEIEKSKFDFYLSSDDLEDMLECPVCLHIPEKPPIFQCPLGHIICSQCHNLLAECPICRQQIGNTRSIISEKVNGCC
jgi:hypothetical protein